MNLDRILNTSIGRNIISVVLGLGVACLFRKACNDKNCIHFQGPIMSDVEGKIFKTDDKCYVYATEHVACDPRKKTIDIAANNNVYEENKQSLNPGQGQSSTSAPAAPIASSKERGVAEKTGVGVGEKGEGVGEPLVPNPNPYPNPYHYPYSSYSLV